MTKTPAATPATAPDLAAATAMWSDYSKSRRPQDAVDSDYTVEHFGDSAKLADELLQIVLSGTKRATAELVSEFTHRGDPLPRIGSHWIACDGAGVPRIVIRSTQLRIDTFDGADADFAYAEGEDDRTLGSWQIQHRLYWERTSTARGATWSELDEIVFEHFAVVWPPEHAD
ncbi:ASCH domain-containing protein [Frigoribacterium sp. 2-23]|uniref:ASCH domain-containing protein n=1 Tax=Frigoribacterium sp. 2-23 TaxID=3415006 RepID=UPI003C6EB5DB